MLLESESLILELWFSTYYMTLNKLLFLSKSYPVCEIGTTSVCAHPDFCLSSSFRHTTPWCYTWSFDYG